MREAKDEMSGASGGRGVERERDSREVARRGRAERRVGSSSIGVCLIVRERREDEEDAKRALVRADDMP